MSISRVFFHVGFVCSVDREFYNSSLATSMFFSGVCEVLPGIMYDILGISCSTLECCMFPYKRCIVFPLRKEGYKHRLTGLQGTPGARGFFFVAKVRLCAAKLRSRSWREASALLKTNLRTLQGRAVF